MGTILHTDVLVVGGGTGAVAAAIQAARRGVQTIIVSEFSWLGGMLTAAGVSAPDGNELAAFQTGLWGAFLQALHQRQPQGLDHAWVSFFTYEPQVGAAILADWVQALPTLQWIGGQIPREVLRQGARIVGVRFSETTIYARITLDGTELGDLLALAEVPHRWGWDWQPDWQEPSAPIAPNPLTDRYPVQAPTWVVTLQDFGDALAPPIALPPLAQVSAALAADWPDYLQQFNDTWEGYGPDSFLNYGRLPGNRFMLNFPQSGNDYGVGLDRLVESAAARQTFLQAAYWHSYSYAYFLQQQLGRRYGFATEVFPASDGLGGGAFALHPYFRESRRLQGLTTITEPAILPLPNGSVATLPIAPEGIVEAIALGNYANDHHYPGEELPLQSKSLRWGGRWTGTPFALPYRCLIPETVDGLLVCEKNLSVSHIANGATRLQPVVLGVGQAAGMAAALCIEQSCAPRDLAVRQLQDALLSDRTAPAAVLPLFNLSPHAPDWGQWQRYYLDHPEAYPIDGLCPQTAPAVSIPLSGSARCFQGTFHRYAEQDYGLTVTEPSDLPSPVVSLVTLWAAIDTELCHLPSESPVRVWGRFNPAGNWILVEQLAIDSGTSPPFSETLSLDLPVSAHPISPA